MGKTIYEFGFSSALTLSKHINMLVNDLLIYWHNTEKNKINYLFHLNNSSKFGIITLIINNYEKTIIL